MFGKLHEKIDLLQRDVDLMAEVLMKRSFINERYARTEKVVEAILEQLDLEIVEPTNKTILRKRPEKIWARP